MKRQILLQKQKQKGAKLDWLQVKTQADVVLPIVTVLPSFYFYFAGEIMIATP